MEWNKEQDHQYFENLWGSRKKSALTHGKEDWDKRAGGWEKGLEEDDKAKARSEARVQRTAEYLRNKGLLKENDEVIDIGCGPGRFVTEFAKTSGHVTGVDISPNMCDFGLNFAHSQGISNVSFTPCDFKNTTVSEMGWEKKFDLVFSSITPAMSTYESLKKSMEMSRRYCFQANWAAVNDPLSKEILGQILPDETLARMERSIRSTYVLVNLLWLEGYLPEVTYYKETLQDVMKADMDFVTLLLKMAPDEDKTEENKEKMLKLLKEKADGNGMIEYNRELLYSWVLWNVNK